ncbi:MAG: Gfo/Idh/MocA family oxidoreductase [Lentisphaeria bacterium]|nr:Gfo/Idh/MocA family oxidoreductase [Lentisphaeria bacterium]
MDSEIRLGVVGYGGRGRGMCKLAASFDGMRLVAACDTEAAKLDLAKEDFPEAKLFEDFEEMMASGLLDTLLVETPGWNHAGFCVRGLENGLHVMSDVPFVYTTEEAEALWVAEQKSDSVFMCGANPNMWGFIQSAVDLHDQGLLGEPYYLETEYIHELGSLFETTPWRASFPSIKYCTHSLGPLLRLVKEDLIEVSCFGTGSQKSGLENYSDAMTALFRTASDVVIKLTCCFSNHFKGGNHSCRIFGSEGYFERFSGRGSLAPPFTMFNSNKLAGAEAPMKLEIDTMLPEYAAKAAGTGHGGADYVLFDRFFKAIRTGGPSPVSLRDGLRMTLPGVFAAESAANGGEKTTITYPWS